MALYAWQGRCSALEARQSDRAIVAELVDAQR